MVHKRLSRKDRGEKGEAMKQTERRGRLLESYLHGMAEHHSNLDEYLGELERERQELERELRDLELRIEANEKKRERVSSYIEEIPQLRNMALRSLMRGMEEAEDG